MHVDSSPSDNSDAEAVSASSTKLFIAKMLIYPLLRFRQRKRPVTARKTGLFVECGVILAKFLF